MIIPKNLNFTDKVLNIVKNFIYIEIALAGMISSAVASIFTDFFFHQFTCSGWLISLVFILLFLIIGTVEFIRKRIQLKRKFYKGDEVQVKGNSDKYIVLGYLYFQPGECVCLHVKSNERKKMPEVAMQKYVYVSSVRSGVYTSRPRR